ncbi:hypothetical protein [Oceanicoccus sp. KOV_DT_Chl]|uniref:hypothetical protein n=1 Tax=Oceanicoccus sp. KOV_DT_Chl TaxID=1904639 RepID=UPI000C7D33E9|nr:hypothetical protein [Oceanicoccus sp. KOV_DT_Chl]
MNEKNEKLDLNVDDNAVSQDAATRQRTLWLQMSYHSLAFISALALWAAADSWALVSNLLLADILLVLASIVFGIVMGQTFHEWGHFIATLKSGAIYSVKPSPRILFFDFDYINNTKEQFLQMSKGGSAGNYVFIALVLLLIPMDSGGRIMLLATAIALAVFVAKVEFPVIKRVSSGEETLEVLADHFAGGLESVFRPAINTAVIAGLGLWLFLCVFF